MRKTRISKYQRLLGILMLFSILLAGCANGDAFAPAPDAIPQTETEAEVNASEENADTEAERITSMVTIVISLLLIASLVGLATSRLRLPYTIGLVLMGLALSLIRGANVIYIPPEIFLGLLVPPLIFEAAFHVKAENLWQELPQILTFAIPGVLITTFLVGGVVTLGTGFSFPLALVFGSLIAASDPVAVVALFRSLGVPKRLEVLLEGESLFNDGTAIVVFNLMVAIAIADTVVLDPLSSVLQFFWVAGGGLMIGLVLGALISRMFSFIEDALIETTLTTVLAFGSYIIAEHFHVSGVLAVVAAGLVSGNIGPRGMSPSTRILVFNFWEYAAFIANSVVFLLIGLQINLNLLLANWQVILWAILAVLVARAVGIYGLSWVGKNIPRSYKHILYWGGLRGAISLALALSLPFNLGPERNEIQAMAFGVVLFTLLVQGLSMKPLINKVDLIQKNEAQEEYQRRHARAVMARAAYDRLEEKYQSGLLSAHVWELMAKPLKQHAQALSESVTEALHVDPKVEGDVIENAMRDLLHTQRSSLTALLRDGIINEEIYAQLVGEVDMALTQPRSNLVELMMQRNNQNICGIMTVIVQEADVENVIASLNRLSIPVTRLSSFGGFLGQKNVTLIAGIPEGQDRNITSAITRASQQRVEFLAAKNPDEASETAVTVGGATIFTFEVERYEEL